MIALALLCAALVGAGFLFRRYLDYENLTIYGHIYPAVDVPGQWVAEDSITGVVTQGDDPTHAEKMLVEAVRIFHVANLEREGRSIEYESENRELFREIRRAVSNAERSSKDIVSVEKKNLEKVYVKIEIEFRGKKQHTVLTRIPVAKVDAAKAETP